MNLAPRPLRRIGLKAAVAVRPPAHRPTLPAAWLAVLLRDLRARRERPCA
jgi:hypothetical protein